MYLFRFGSHIEWFLYYLLILYFIALPKLSSPSLNHYHQTFSRIHRLGTKMIMDKFPEQNCAKTWLMAKEFHHCTLNIAMKLND